MIRSLLILFAVFLAAIAMAVDGTAGPYHVDLKTDPATVPVGRAKLLIKLTDKSGKPVTGATVKTLAKMPGMVMGEREETAAPQGASGEYVAPAVFAMGGAYEVRISISGPLGAATTSLPLSTGQAAASGGGLPLVPIFVGIALVIAVFLVVRQTRRTGQKLDVRSLFSLNVILSLGLLGLALAIAVWAVNTQRREGAMTPIEAQVMDMNTPAPEGVLPVRLVKVESKPFSASVTYSGQAVGFVEQAVVPRVTGTIISMPYYVGANVKKGQVLARLDTTQLDPMVGEKAAGVATAQQGVSVAAMEYQQMLNGVTQARAEVSMAEGEVAEARAMLEAARQGRGSAESEIAAAQAEVQAMNAELTSAQADANYQGEELKRMRALFDQGAISRDEWQRAQADAAKAEAEVSKAREKVRQAQAGVTSARAGLRRVDAEISAARRKVQQAEAQVRAKQANVRTAQSAADAAKGRIGQSRAEVSEAAAGLRGAAAQRGYAELRAEVDGVITERVISPGVLVNPGQTVLKVAQISPIRLQANVPEADLAKIRAGARVEISRRDSDEEPVVLRVNSVSPAVDANSRTGVVEALYPNRDRKFLPGQFLTMRIFTEDADSSLVVPSDAVQSSEDGDFVWVAEPGMNGEYTVSRTQVKLGGKSGRDAAVVEGLTEGQFVVATPPYGLVAGTRVSSTDNGSVATDIQTIEITEAGYVPPNIKVPANKPFKVTFIRRAAETCGDEVIFPDLNIRKKLPLNEPVTIDLPAMPGGKTLNFACPMNMLKGKAVSQ